jgi:hypothetical protein
MMLVDFHLLARKPMPYFFHPPPLKILGRHYVVHSEQHLIQQDSRKNQNKNVAIKTCPSLKFIVFRLVFPPHFFARGPILASKITTDPHIHAHSNWRCSDVTYPNLDILAQLICATVVGADHHESNVPWRSRRKLWAVIGWAGAEHPRIICEHPSHPRGTNQPIKIKKKSKSANRDGLCIVYRLCACYTQ